MTVDKLVETLNQMQQPDSNGLVPIRFYSDLGTLIHAEMKLDHYKDIVKSSKEHEQ